MDDIIKLAGSLNMAIIYVLGVLGLIVLLVLYALGTNVFKYLGTVLWDYIKKKLFATSRMTNKFRDNIRFIDDLMIESRNKLNADRCYVFEFHNGEYFSSRESRWKVSQVYESCGEGISSRGKEFKDIDVSMLWSAFQVYFSHTNDKMPQGIETFKPATPLCNNDKKKCDAPKRLYLFDVERIENRFYKSLLERSGVKTMIHAPILDEHNDIVGVIGVDYVDEKPISEYKTSEEYEFCSLCRAADQIAYSWTILKNKK